MGNYHHHQNPSAFNLDLTVISTVCSIYAADGLYAIDSARHSPLIGFAYDGFPIYGAYAYKNANGTGGIVRMKSSYTLRNITTRTTSPTGNPVLAGPPVSATYPLGYFREDYQYNATSAATPDYLDEHNGRFCITPEYPAGTYCYYATVDSRWNSAYPYVVGPTFYGVLSAVKVNGIAEPVTQYIQSPTVTPAVASLNCAGVTFSSNAIVNTAYNGVATLPYVGGNGLAYTNSAPIASTGVTGLSAVLQSGTLINGNGNLSLVITGTPTSIGSANFLVNFGGQSCTFSLPVNSVIVVPPIVASLSCGSAITTPATINVGYNATVSIPYTAGNGLAYTSGNPIFSSGVTGMSAQLQPGTLAFGDGNLNYNITGVPSNTGNANFLISFGGQTCTLTVIVIDVLSTRPEVSSLQCGSAIISSVLSSGVIFSGTVTIGYTGGNGIAYPFQGPIVSSTGVTGLTVSLQPGVLNNGNGNLIFTLSGTPSSSGIAYFNLDFGGQMCTLAVNVAAANFDFIIVPNPVEDKLFVRFTNADTKASFVWIYDEAGKLVFTLPQPSFTNGIDISKIPMGNYSIKIMDQSSNIYLTKKFVKGRKK
jgi:hypothetical protein